MSSCQFPFMQYLLEDMQYRSFQFTWIKNGFTACPNLSKQCTLSFLNIYYLFCQMIDILTKTTLFITKLIEGRGTFVYLHLQIDSFGISRRYRIHMFKKYMNHKEITIFWFIHLVFIQVNVNLYLRVAAHVFNLLMNVAFKLNCWNR